MPLFAVIEKKSALYILKPKRRTPIQTEHNHDNAKRIEVPSIKVLSWSQMRNHFQIRYSTKGTK